MSDHRSAPTGEPLTSRRTYVLVCAALLGLTALSIGLAHLDLAGWNTFLALAIAAGQAALINLFYMRARSFGGMPRLVIAAGLLWLGILMAGTLDDALTRGWLPVPGK